MTKKINLDPKWVMLLIWLSLVCLICWMSSCTTTSKVNKFVTKNPVYTANLCDSLYPIKTSTDTQYITDSGLLQEYEREFAVLYAMIDSMTLDSAKIFFRTIVKERFVPKERIVTVTKESTAKLDKAKFEWNEKEKGHILEKEELRAKINALEAQKEKLIEDKDKAEKARKTANNWAMRWLIGFLCTNILENSVRLVMLLTLMINNCYSPKKITIFSLRYSFKHAQL